jgi:hypothetical protein
MDGKAEVPNADRLPWEQWDGETDMAFRAFRSWLDSSDRRHLRDFGPSALNWSSRWSWAMRAREYDRHMVRIDTEEQVRHRRKMEARNRQMASVALAKVVQWLNGLTPEKIAKISVADAMRFWLVAERIEREATLAVDMDDLDDPPPRENGLEKSLKEKLLGAGLDVPMSELAEFLRERVAEPPAPPAASSHPVQVGQPAPAPPAVAQVAVDTDMRAVWREMDSQGEGGVPWGAAPAEVRRPRRGR